MKLYIFCKFGLLLGGVLATSSAYSHPYDSPLEFRLHKTNDGRTIYSNIPKKCFSDGRLTCYRLHPIFPQAKPIPPEAEPQISAPSEPDQ
jgi:hypothetical protein